MAIGGSVVGALFARGDNSRSRNSWHWGMSHDHLASVASDLVIESLGVGGGLNHHFVRGLEIRTQPILQLGQLNATWMHDRLELGIDAANDHSAYGRQEPST
jgi:hypothetical protein